QRMMHEHIKEIQSRSWPRIKRIACDPAGAGPNEQTAISNVQLLRKSGYSVRTRASNIPDGVELVRAAIQPAYGNPRLFVNPRCKHLIKALTCYRYPDGGGEIPFK